MAAEHNTMNKNSELPYLNPHERISLPPGAHVPVQNVVAGRILEIMFQDKLVAKSQQNNNDNHKKPAFSEMESKALLDLVTRYPASCQRKYSMRVSSDSNSKTEEAYPLLFLLHLNPSLNLVEKVFEAHPDAIFNGSSYRPIDMACEMNASLEVVKFLHFQNPKALQTPLPDGRYALHVALSFYSQTQQNYCNNNEEEKSKSSTSKSTTSVIDFLLDTFPEAASRPDSRGHYPFHHAAFGGAPVSILRRLYQLCPASASATDDKNWTPLHYACRYLRNNKDNLAIISYLIKVAPASLTIRNAGGWTPVMTGVGHETPQVISLLLDHAPNVEQAHAGRSMLHLAAKHNEADAVDILASRFPWMLITNHGENSSGGTPLHYACKRNDNPLDIVRVLIRHDRRALLAPDRLGKIPLNWAYQIQPDSDVTKLLMEETAKGAHI